jgi:hypothetical protein
VAKTRSVKGTEIRMIEVLIQQKTKALMERVKEGWGTRSKDRKVGREIRMIEALMQRKMKVLMTRVKEEVG